MITRRPKMSHVCLRALPVISTLTTAQEEKKKKKKFRGRRSKLQVSDSCPEWKPQPLEDDDTALWSNCGLASGTASGQCPVSRSMYVHRQVLAQ